MNQTPKEKIDELMGVYANISAEARALMHEFWNDIKELNLTPSVAIEALTCMLLTVTTGRELKQSGNTDLVEKIFSDLGRLDGMANGHDKN